MTDPGEEAVDARVWPGMAEMEDRSPGYLNGAAFLTLDNQAREKSTPVPVTVAYPAAVYADHALQHSHQIVADVEEIVIYCGNQLSDYLFALPALNALRLTYPEAEIVLFSGARIQAFLQGRPGPVDRVETDLRSLAGISFDLALYLGRPDSGTEPVDMRRWIRARLVVGLEPNSDRSLPFAYDQHNLLRNLEMVSLIGARGHELDPQVVLTDQDRLDSRALVPETDNVLIVLAPGGVDPRRRWPVEKFAAIGWALSRAGVQILVSGKQEDPEVEALINLLPAATFLDEAAPVGALGAVLQRARLVIANAGNLLYLAQAAGSRTLGIYWCADLMTSGPLTRSRHRPAISWQLTCPECGLNLTRASCGHQASLVAGISQEEVLTSALELAGLQPQILLAGPAIEDTSPDQAGPAEREARTFQSRPDLPIFSGLAA